METPTTPDPGPACSKDAASSPGSCTATRRGTPSGRTSRRGTRGLLSRSPSLPLRRRPLRLNDPCSSGAKSNERVDNADVSCSNAKCAYPADSRVYIVGCVAAYFSRVARVEANASLYGSQAVFVHFGKEPSTKHRRDPEKRRTGTQIRYSRQGAHIWVACTRHRLHLTMMHVDVQRARTPRAINEHQGSNASPKLPQKTSRYFLQLTKYNGSPQDHVGIFSPTNLNQTVTAGRFLPPPIAQQQRKGHPNQPPRRTFFFFFCPMADKVKKP